MTIEQLRALYPLDLLQTLTDQQGRLVYPILQAVVTEWEQAVARGLPWCRWAELCGLADEARTVEHQRRIVGV